MITLRDGGSAGFVTVTGQILMAAHSPSRAHKEPLCTFPYRSTYDAVLVLEPADDEAGRELSSRLEDVAHSKHMAPGLSRLSSWQGPRRVPPGGDRPDDRGLT
jgi:hypothetical protein